MVPMGSQLQASHPIPDAIFQWSASQRSHDWPMTFGKHGHCPVVRSHEPPSISVPSMLHTQAVDSRERERDRVAMSI